MDTRKATVILKLKEHLKKVNELSARDLSDELVFSALTMECFQAVNRAIDLGEIIIAEKDLGFPEKYKEIFEFLAKAKVIKESRLAVFKRLVFLRNLISHEYYNIDQTTIKEMISLLPVLEDLIK